MSDNGAEGPRLDDPEAMAAFEEKWTAAGIPPAPYARFVFGMGGGKLKVKGLSQEDLCRYTEAAAALQVASTAVDVPGLGSSLQVPKEIAHRVAQIRTEVEQTTEHVLASTIFAAACLELVRRGGTPEVLVQYAHACYDLW